mgnify:CR=1 FL=1
MTDPSTCWVQKPHCLPEHSRGATLHSRVGGASAAICRNFRQLPPVRADRQQLQVVLTQLLDNARRYTQAGSVFIRAHQHGDTVQVDITDTGPGISSEEFSQLFTRFHRVEGNSSPERGGGLGLAIARQLIERQGGRVWAESTPGQGSTFSIALLVANEHADAVADPKRQSA